LRARKSLREARYDHTPDDYAQRLAAVQVEINTAIARIQALHQLVQEIRD